VRKSIMNPVAWVIVLAGTSVSFGAEQWSVETGSATLYLNESSLEQCGFSVVLSRHGATQPATSEVSMSLLEGSTVEVRKTDGTVDGASDGSLKTDLGLVITVGNTTVEIGQLVLRPFVQGSSSRVVIVDGLSTSQSPLLDLGAVKCGIDSAFLAWESADVSIAPTLARALGNPELQGTLIGSMRGKAYFPGGLAEAGTEASLVPVEVGAAALDQVEVRGGNNGTNCWNPGEPAIGPDVIVGDIIDLSNYPAAGGIEAYAVGTTSCNIGSANLLWQDNTPNVPVIGQSFFRLHNGRFEQIGQGWLKYAFTALTQNACGCGCSGQGQTVLGVGCSDPYCCGLNGQQGSLGPKYQINAYTGSHPSNQPSCGGATPCTGTIARRLQVKVSDFDPVIYAGALYFAEAQYVTPDDAAAGHQFNNASYRRISIAAGTFEAGLMASTQREQPVIRAWKDTDPTVQESDVFVPNEGLVILAWKVTDLGGGQWHYEYALQNLNSDRSVRSFSVPIGSATITPGSIGFHDVDYHSGEVQDNTDWTPTIAGGAITWSTQTFAENANANALRWGTLFNFRFDANGPPTRIGVDLGLFKTGAVMTLNTSADGPFVCIPEECEDGNPCTDDGCGPTSCTNTFNTAACNDANNCTINDACSSGTCVGTPTVIIPGDVFPSGGNGILDVDDMICELLAFFDLGLCPEADIFPCGKPDGIIDVDDLSVVLGAFTQQYVCPVPCPP